MNKIKLLPVMTAAVMLTACSSAPVIIDQGEYTEISLSWWGNDARTEYTLAAVKEFEKQHPDIRVKCSYSEWSGYQTRYNIHMASNTETDVMLINFAWLDQYSADGNGYYDIYTLKDDFDLTQFSDSELSFGIRNGKLNAIPIALNTQTAYYNKTIYDSFGLELPQTWDDLFNAGKVMSESDVYPLSMPSKSALFVCIAYAEQMTGKSFMTEDGQVNFGVDEVVLMLDLYKRLINEHVMPQIEYFDRNCIRSGTYAGSVAWLSDAENYMGSAREEGYEVVVGNYIGCGDGAEGWYTKPATMYAVSANTEHPREAAILLDFILNSDEISELQGIEKGIPLSRASRDYLEKHDMLKGLHYDAFTLMSERIDDMDLIDPFMENTSVLEEFQDAFNAVLFDKASAEERAAQLLEAIKEMNS